MRAMLCLAVPAFAFAVAAGAPPADENAPLLKAVVPPGTSIRVRIPITEERGTTMQFEARLPRGKAKKSDKTDKGDKTEKTDKDKTEKGEAIDVTVGIENLPGTSYVSAKLWQSWGYEIPANKTAVLPELIVPASQIAPKTTKGRDVLVRIPAIRLEIIEPPANADKIRGCDIFLTLKELTKNADRTFETRLYFQDRFLELTVPAGSVKRQPGSGDEDPPELTNTADPTLVPVASPMNSDQGMPLFAYVSTNGLTKYRTPEGKIEPVVAAVSWTNDWPTGAAMTIGAARGCNVQLEDGKEMKGLGATFQTTVVKAKIKELRLGAMTGNGLKVQKDIVIKDLIVYVDKSNSGHFLWLGPRFLDTYMKDSVLACASDGNWQLFGRMKSDLLQDIKTRPKMP